MVEIGSIYWDLPLFFPSYFWNILFLGMFICYILHTKHSFRHLENANEQEKYHKLLLDMTLCEWK